MRKKVFVFLLFVVALMYGFTTTKALAYGNEQSSTQIEPVNTLKELPIELKSIFESKEFYKNLNKDEKIIVCNFFNIDDKDAVFLDKKGYLLNELINIINISKYFSFSISDIERLYESYNDFGEIVKQKKLLDILNDKEKVSDEKKDKLKKLLKEGYSFDEIKSIYIISETFQINIDKILKKNNEEKLDEILKNFTNINNDEELSTVEDLFNNYCIDIPYLLNYLSENKIAIQEAKNNIDEFQESMTWLNSDPEVMSLTSTTSTSDEDNEYFNAPFLFRENNNEYISPANGSLSFESIDFNLPGRNGLDVNIITRYDSSIGFLKQPDVDVSYDEYGYADYYNSLNTNTYEEKTSGLGAGWSFGFSSIEKVSPNILHLENGSQYTRLETTTTGDSNLKGYKLKGIRLEYESNKFTFLSSTGTTISSRYTVYYKDGKREYFDTYGRLIGIVDKFNNTIKFEYTYTGSVSLSSSVVNNIKIFDTVGRTIEIKYQTISATEKRVSIVVDGSTKVQYVLKPTDTDSTEFILSEKIDALNRKTTYYYKFDDCKFNFLSKTPYKLVKTANLVKIEYPTKAFSEYIYEKSIANLTSKGATEYYRIIERKDAAKDLDVDKLVYNAIETYSYDGNYSGYKVCNSPNSLPSDYTYSTTITKGKTSRETKLSEGTTVFTTNSQKIKYTFNNKHLKINEDVKEERIVGTINQIIPPSPPNPYADYIPPKPPAEVDEQTITVNNLINITYTYNENKLPVTEVTTTYGPSGESTSNTNSWIYDDYGEVLEHINELGYKTTNAYIDIKTLDYPGISNFHMLKEVYKEIDIGKIQRVSYDLKKTSNGTSNIYSLVETKYHDNNDITQQISTEYTYDIYGNIIAETHKLDGIETMKKLYEYGIDYKNVNQKGAYLTKTNVTVRAYDINGAPTSSTIEEKFAYDFTTGNKIFLLDSKNRETNFRYDELNRVVFIDNPGITSKTIYYNDTDNSVIFIEENGLKTLYIYDGLGRLRRKQVDRINDSIVNWITIEDKHYDEIGRVDSIKDGNGNETKYIYDILGRVIETIHPDSTSITQVKSIVEYNDGLNMKTEYDEENNPHEYYFDAAGNLIKEIVYQDKYNASTECITEYSYDNNGNVTSIIDANLNGTQYIYDDLGRLIEVVNALGESTQYEYDSLDNLIKVTTAGTSYTYKEYDQLGRLIKETDPMIKSEYISYDSVGNIQKKRDKKGQILEFTYDDLNRVLTQTIGNERIQYTYKTTYPEYDETIIEKGTVTESGGSKVFTSLETITYHYNKDGSLKKEIYQGGKTIEYQYDNNGNKIKVTDGFDSAQHYTEYRYDKRNRLEFVIADGRTTKYEYYKNGNRKNIKYNYRIENGLQYYSAIEEYVYDDCKNLLELRNSTKDSALTEKSKYYYKYDAVGNQISRIEDDKGPVTYTYDFLNRVKTILEPDETLTEYKYDGNGNVKSKVISKSIDGIPTGRITDYDYDGGNHLVTSEERPYKLTIASLKVSPYEIGLDADEAVDLCLSGTFDDGSDLPSELLDGAVWISDYEGLVFSSVTGREITISLPKAAWDSLSFTRRIKVTATIGDKSVSGYIYKDPHIKSLTINADRVGLYSSAEQVTFTLSGMLDDGSTTSSEILSLAQWSSTDARLILSPTVGVSTVGHAAASALTYLINPTITARIGAIQAQCSIEIEIFGLRSFSGTNNTSEPISGDKSSEDSLSGEINQISNGEVIPTLEDNGIIIVSFSYNDNGNMVKQVKKVNGIETETFDYDYNNWNQLTRYLKTGSSSNAALYYTYYPNGLRSKQVVDGIETQYYYDGQNVAYEVGSGFTARNIWGINSIARQYSDTTLFYLYNGHADVVAMIDEQGNIVNSYDYDIYGNIIEKKEQPGKENPIRYAGQYYDSESDLYYLRARYYDPGVMRFITEDTNKGDVKDPLSLNLYTYCQGNPIRYFDPTGHAPGDLFRSMEDAAYDFGLTYNEKSIEAHQEYGSSIYFVKIEVIMDHSIETGVDFKNTVVYYSYTKPNIGNGGNSVLPSITLKGAIVATVHSHGNYVVQYKGGNDVMSFSKPGGDSWWSDIFNIPAYMVNPKGELLRYIPDSEDKRGKVIRKWLPHDPFHPDWRSRKWFYQQVE